MYEEAIVGGLPRIASQVLMGHRPESPTGRGYFADELSANNHKKTFLAT